MPLYNILTVAVALSKLSTDTTEAFSFTPNVIRAFDRQLSSSSSSTISTTSTTLSAGGSWDGFLKACSPPGSPSFHENPDKASGGSLYKASGESRSEDMFAMQEQHTSADDPPLVDMNEGDQELFEEVQRITREEIMGLEPQPPLQQQPESSPTVPLSSFEKLAEDVFYSSPTADNVFPVLDALPAQDALLELDVVPELDMSPEIDEIHELDEIPAQDASPSLDVFNAILSEDDAPPAAEDTPPAAEDTPPAEEDAPPAAEDTPPAAQDTPPAEDTPSSTQGYFLQPQQGLIFTN